MLIQLKKWIESHERSYMTFMALVIGVAAGYVAVLLRICISGVRDSSGALASAVSVDGIPAWLIQGGLAFVVLSLVAITISMVAPETKGSGIPEVMESLALRNGFIRARVALVKLLATAATLGIGGSAGREGPIVQIGSSLGSTAGQLAKVSDRRMRALVACGASAGLAATFNAPIAGVLFALELLLRRYSLISISPIVISSVIATVVGRYHFGDYPAFTIPQALHTFTWASFMEIGTFLALGLIAGAAGVLFSRSIYWLADLYDLLKMPFWARGTAGAAIVALIIILFPQVAGVGYQTIEMLMNNGEGLIGGSGIVLSSLGGVWLVALLLYVLKVVATSFTLSSGASGGIFAPSLFMGAAVGFVFGYGLNQIAPDLVNAPGAYALVGMAALVAGATHTPMTSIIIIFEMTGDYRIILPLMLSCIAASLVATRLDQESIFTRKLARRGLFIRGGRDESVLDAITVGQVMNPVFTTISIHAPFREIVKIVTTGRQLYFPVVTKDNCMVGVIDFLDVQEHLFDKELSELVIALDVMVKDPLYLKADDTLLHAFEVFDLKDIDQLPVVDPRNCKRAIGMVSRRDLLRAYNSEVLKKGKNES